MPLDLIERFEAGGTVFQYAVAGLTRARETARPGPGAWSLAELAAHLVDSDLVATDRMKRVIAEDQPVLLAFDENAWVARLNSRDQSATEAASLFAANRRWMARVLRRLVEADFARTGQHTERGSLTLAELLATSVGHLDHHLRFLYAKRANLGVSLYPRYSANDAGKD